MSVQRYRGWFLPEHQELREWVALVRVFQPVPWRVLDAVQHERDAESMHALAMGVEDKLFAHFPSHQREDEGDPDLLLRTVDSTSPEAASAAASELAVMAIWKAVALAHVQRAPTISPFDALEDLRSDDERARSASTYRQGLTELASRLTFEMTRAATLAAEMSARPQLVAEAVKVQRESQARGGGLAKARAYQAVRDRVLELARANPASSRNKTATAVHELLQLEGIEIAWTTVQKYLADHDARMLERQRLLKS